MVFISLAEVIDIIIMSLAIGFIFKDVFKKQIKHNGEYDPLKDSRYTKKGIFDGLKTSIMIAAPAVVLHELAHKFVAMGFGAEAVLHAPYFMYVIVIILKLIGFPLIFLVGGYVAHTPLAAFPSAMVSVAGPLMNFILWGGIMLGIKNHWFDRKYYKILVPMAKLNLLLGVFNMIPIPGFDGFHFFSSLFALF